MADVQNYLAVQASAQAGRVALFDAPDLGNEPITNIRILSQGEHGHVSVTSSGRIALVLSENPQETAPLSFSYEVTYADGTVRNVSTGVNVTPPTQQSGWSTGQNIYMLERDESGKTVVEHGDNHRKVFVSGGDHALTRAEIAEREGLDVSQITTRWLVNNPRYGGSQDMAVDSDVGMSIWYESTASKNGPVSHWLLFERGYEYENTGRLINRGTNGEGELKPQFVGAYGEGDDPMVHSPPNIFQNQTKHVVIQGLNFPSFTALLGENILLDSISLSNDAKDGFNIQNVEGFTLVNSDITDIVRTTPVNTTGDTWFAHNNRISGAYFSNVDGLLLLDNFVDHSGWVEGYRHDMSKDGPQPPSMYSHNFYLQHNNRDVNMIGNIIMRGASFGAQVRPGGFIEGNVFIDNNGALNDLGAPENGVFLGHHSLLLNNIITSAGHKRVGAAEGALSYGIDSNSQQSAFVDNIVAHMWDPNNPAEKSIKTVAHNPFKKSSTTTYDDTIVYNWYNATRTPTDVNVSGRDKAVLDQTTIQNFTAQLLGKETATISDLSDHIRAQFRNGTPLDEMTNAQVINRFFQVGFGIATELRDTEATLTFSPDERGEGMRWDNRLNWSTNDLPSSVTGDSVDLAGNRVLFNSHTSSVKNLTLGRFGQLSVASGKLSVTGEILSDGASGVIEISKAGQFWINGSEHADEVSIEVSGGRFANTGAFHGLTTISISGNAEALLAGNSGTFDLVSGSRMNIEGGLARTGFDGRSGTDTAFRMHDDSHISFVADDTGLGKVSEFRSGAFGATTDIRSGIRLNGTLHIDISKASLMSGRKELMSADQVIGDFSAVNIIGLASNQNAEVVIDYDADKVFLNLGVIGAGNGEISRISLGEETRANASEEDLRMWALLMADPHVSMPDPVEPDPEPETPEPEVPGPGPLPETPAPEPDPDPVPETPAPEVPGPTPEPEVPGPTPTPETPSPEQPGTPDPEPDSPAPNPEVPTPAPETPTPSPEVPGPSPDPDDEEDPQDEDNASGGGCFVATAAYGHRMHPEVVALRAFRDKHLVRSKAGRAFVRTYWVIGPRIAQRVSPQSTSGMFIRSALGQVVNQLRKRGLCD